MESVPVSFPEPVTLPRSVLSMRERSGALTRNAPESVSFFNAALSSREALSAFRSKFLTANESVP